MKNYSMMNTYFETINSNGEFSCGNIGITKEIWFNLLIDSEAQPYIDALLCFLREPEHKSSCKNIAIKYAKTPSHYNGKITNFSKWVQKN